MSKQISEHNRGQVVFGTIIILLGVFFLLGNLFQVNIGRFFWPLVLIGLGVWLMAQPRLAGPDTAVTQRFFGEIDRRGPWLVENESFQMFISDVALDLTKADIPDGETRLRFSAFVSDVELFLPEDVGIAVNASGFVNEMKLDEHKEESFLGPIRYQTEDYKLAQRRVRIDTSAFINEIKIRRI